MRSLLRLCFIFCFILFSQISFSQSGKISGKVTDASTGEPLPFVNIIVEETSMGAASNIDGLYSIIGLSPGTYSIRASAIGYTPVNVTEVRVSIDLTTNIDFELSEASIELGEEVIVIATRPLITKDRTSSTAIVGSDEIAALPVTEFQEVLSLKAGYVGGSVRGGRSGEVVYAIDGVPMTDVYDGSTVVDVSTSSIQELQFVSGAFNAEYGKALSGYVNIATKDGSNDFTGNISSYVGDHISGNTDIFRGVDKVEPANIYNFEGSLSGPIIPNSLFFYANARYIHFGGWLYGRRVFNPWDITINQGPQEPIETRYLVEQTGDGELVSMNGNRKIYGQGKLTFKPFTAARINYNFIYDNVEYRDYDHSFAFNPDGDFQRFRMGHTNILGLTHTLSSATFYQANFSYFFKRYKQYAYESPFDPRYTHEILLNQQPTEVPSFRTGGTQNSRFQRITNTYGFKFDITSQVTQVHQIKAGIEANRHNLGFEDIALIQWIDRNGNGVYDPDEGGVEDPQISGNPYVNLRIPNINDPNENLRINTYQRNPIELSAYLQDKIELNELIINIGLRFDYFIPDGKLLVDPTDPDIYRPVRPQNMAMSLEERKAIWYNDPSHKYKLSPRLGVAFPITDRGVIHFSYGHFFQTPNFELLFRNPEYKFGQGTGNVGIAGNPDLNPQETISGEVGVQQALSDEITIDLTGYFRDIRNLAGTRADEIRIFDGRRYSQFINSDFGFVKGIVFTLTKRLSNNWAATIDYTLQSAKGNASDPSATINQKNAGELPEIQLIRLDWDQAHTINATFSYANPDDWGFSFIAQYGSGFPYTPSQSLNLSDLLRNSELKPSSFNVDLRAYKDILLAGLKFTLFARVYNLFDLKNQLNVYNDSGTADFTLDEYLRRNDDNPDELINTLDEFYRNPTFYSEPRRVEVGASIFF
jgi:hypothetical protein